jgi:hypothetical protein
MAVATEYPICNRQRSGSAVRTGEQIDVPEEALLVKGVFDGVEAGWPGLLPAMAGCVGRAGVHRRWFSQALAGREGRSRPGCRPARRGSLEGPGGLVVASHTGDQAAAWAVLLAPVLAGHSGPHHC